MSGARFNRRLFLQMGATLLFTPFLFNCNKKKKNIGVNTAGANSKVGHLLRNNQFPEVQENIKIKTLIVGGGVAGLSAGRWLKKETDNDFLILEMDNKVGGNSKGGKNNVSEYPYAAHYLPIPNNENEELLLFLKDNGIITGFNANGLPIYNPYYLCFNPNERLYYKGIWQDDLPPKEGLMEAEINELKRFHNLMNVYKNKVGNDQKRAFTIPLEYSSNDEAFTILDKMTMNDFMKENGFQTEFIYWYLNYCCKDDFGTDMMHTSAWAAIHYFASRNGRADNASSDELLTWPEGNYFLVKKLRDPLLQNIKTNQLVYNVQQKNGIVECLVYDLLKNISVKYECENLILATPQYINKKLLKSESVLSWEEFKYYPWLVANITIDDKFKLNGDAGLSWDNVFYNSKSLGYVNACHQTLEQHQPKTVITYYYNFSDKEPKESRLAIMNNDENYWKDFITKDLINAHPDIEANMEHIELYIWGHGMISPAPGFLHSETRRTLAKGIGNIHFAHSDISGISIFEQAFYRGTQAAKNTMNNKIQNG